MGKCENCGNDREEYLNYYCKVCLDKMTQKEVFKENLSKEITDRDMVDFLTDLVVNDSDNEPVSYNGLDQFFEEDTDGKE